MIRGKRNGHTILGRTSAGFFRFRPERLGALHGQLLPINQNQALFSLLGTTYGGNGQTNFALPNLQGRAALHFDNLPLGTAAGQYAHTLTMSEMPQHVHLMQAIDANADTDNPFTAPKGSLAQFNNGYRSATNLTTLASGTVTNVGGSQAHENTQPYLVLNYVIALQGIFPSRN